MTRNRQRHIVVGVSGSRASGAALSWAVEEARLRQANLHVVWAWDPARHAAPYAAVGVTPTREEQRAAARARLAAAMRAEFGPATPGNVTAELAEGVPERLLLDHSADADLLVLGVTAPAWLAGRSAGPVVRACLARARCPVVVIGGADAEPCSSLGHDGDRAVRVVQDRMRDRARPQMA
jgi:nucleotide-binding universal stress UspA family protein